MRGQQVYPGHPDAYAHFAQFEDAFRTESDRGVAVLSMCVIEELLNERISNIVGTHSPEMVKVLAPPGRWSVLADAATMLGLLSPAERDDLKVLIKIRNWFAHKAMESLAFDHADVIDHLSRLKIYERFQVNGPAPINPRERFLNGVAAIYLIICMRDGVPPFEQQSDLHMSAT
ncbi:hypothetical protein [Tahibacter soli]|uniref:Mannitol repressor n=1 Tax=Tahibacter soli TaxID=2983605 RepID=A0A9X4BHE6_9GAMM|nr:hypothetical protein [Tahibacter soli]MDC8010977.1 hypothetical protein [Tahibacter soli]